MNRSRLIRGMWSAAFVLLGAGITAYAQPKIEIVGGNTHDWGTVAPGTLTAVVEVKNSGTSELKVTDVHPGCGCTVTHGIDKNVLKPGEVGKFDVSINVASYNSGPYTKIVRINSNDATDSIHIVSLQFTIKRSVTVTPMNYFQVTDAKAGVETISSAVHIKNTGDKPLTLSVPEFGGQGNVKVRFDMKEPKELQPGEEMDVRAYITPLEAVGQPYGSIKIKTNSTESPIIDLSVTGNMAAPPQGSIVDPAHSIKDVKGQ